MDKYLQEWIMKKSADFASRCMVEDYGRNKLFDGKKYRMIVRVEKLVGYSLLEFMFMEVRKSKTSLSLNDSAQEIKEFFSNQCIETLIVPSVCLRN